MTRREPAAEREAAEALALRALAFLAEDPERLGRFLALTGLGPAELRMRAGDADLLGGVLDHLLRTSACFWRSPKPARSARRRWCGRGGFFPARRSGTERSRRTRPTGPCCLIEAWHGE